MQQLTTRQTGQLTRWIGILGALLLMAVPSFAQQNNTICDSVTVSEGDTLYDIARQCGTTVPAIIEANIQINEPDVLDPGETLEIPSAEEARQPVVTIFPQRVNPGGVITVTGNGFPLTVPVRVGAGVDGSEILISQTVRTSRSGAFQIQLAIPENAELDDRWSLVAETTDDTPYEATSFAFFIEEQSTRPTTPEPTLPPENQFTQTEVYLIAPDSGGDIGCGDSVVPYTISIEPTVAPLSAALENLFSIQSRFVGQAGLYNALYQSDLSVQGIDIENRVADINLSGELVSGGACDAPRIVAQLEQTALQYRTIDAVNISINGEPLADVLDLQGS